MTFIHFGEKVPGRLLQQTLLVFFLMSYTGGAASAGSGKGPGSANAARKSDIIRVDLRKSTIGNVNFSETLSEIRSSLGSSNVESFSYEAEGEKQRGYRLNFGDGRIVVLRWNDAEFDDKRFRTSEGLGVGSTWTEFKTIYKDANFMPSPESGSIWSETYKFHLFFKYGSKPRDGDHVIRIGTGKFPARYLIDEKESW